MKLGRYLGHDLYNHNQRLYTGLDTQMFCWNFDVEIDIYNSVEGALRDRVRWRLLQPLKHEL